jgi:ankyrin repeat protein
MSQNATILLNSAFSGLSAAQEAGKQLIEALKNDNTDIAKNLIEEGADVNFRDEHGMTPLHAAVTYQLMDIVNLLLDYNADVNGVDQDGNTPLHIAIHLYVDSPFRFRYGLIADQLIERGANVLVRDAYGSTPLQSALARGLQNTAMLILRKEGGSVINMADRSGKTPLHEAAEGGYVIIMKFMLRFQVDLNPRNYEGISPLHLAAHNGQKGIALMLGRKGADVDIRDKDGLTPLHYAVIDGHMDVVETLVKYGATVNEVDNDGNTPLHFAAAYARIKIAENLVEGGALLHITNRKGQTPKQMAALNHPETLREWDYLESVRRN